LPPPPATIEPVAFAVVPVVYTAPAIALDLPVHTRPAQPRGPPALV
jgi:hypothetical protein